MDTFVITGGTPLRGTVSVGGAKNVAIKILIASLLTNEEIVIKNVPNLRDVAALIDILKSLGVAVSIEDHVVKVQCKQMGEHTTVPLDVGARLRTSSMVLGPLLARWGQANVPNPGGCRLGARPIDRHIEGLKKMGADIVYNSDDGYFHAQSKGLTGTTISFEKNTHTGTETILLAAVLARGTTIIENAAEEVEVDDLINCLNQMGAQITRVNGRTIQIVGVEKLHGTTYSIMPDRNEEVTFAIAAAITGGDITVSNSQLQYLSAFLDVYTAAGGQFEKIDETHTRYYRTGELRSSNMTTAPYPGFMTDWQAPWAVFMTQAGGESTIHETVFEGRFSYVQELRKMGAKIDFFDPPVDNPESFYNFNWEDRKEGYHQGIHISGKTSLHNAILEADDIRAGATLVLAALVAKGESYVHGVERIDRGYEKLEERLKSLGASITRVKEDK